MFYNKNILEKEVGKLVRKSNFYTSLNELEDKIRVGDIEIEIEGEEIDWNFVAPTKLTNSFKKLYKISEVEDITLTKSEITLDGVEFLDLEVEETDDLKAQYHKRIDNITNIINTDLDNINRNFTHLQTQISLFIDKIDETSKTGFFNALKRFINSQNKQRVIDNYMQIVELNKFELKQNIWEQRKKLYLENSGNIFTVVKEKIKALYKLKTLKFIYNHLKSNEEHIYTQIEDIVDEAYQILYLEKVDTLAEKNDQVISIKDGEIYKLTYKDVMSVLKSYDLILHS